MLSRERMLPPRPRNPLGDLLSSRVDAPRRELTPEPHVPTLPLQHRVNQQPTLARGQPITIRQHPNLRRLILHRGRSRLRGNAPHPRHVPEVLQRTPRRRQIEVDKRHRQAAPKHRVVRPQVVMTNHRVTPRKPAPPSSVMQPPRQSPRGAHLRITPSPEPLRNHPREVTQDVPPNVIPPKPPRRPREPALLQLPKHQSSKGRRRPTHGASDAHNPTSHPASPQHNLLLSRRALACRPRPARRRRGHLRSIAR